jgi:glucokinase
MPGEHQPAIEGPALVGMAQPAGERDHPVEERHRATGEPARPAGERDHPGGQRDRATGERDHPAGERDRATGERDHPGGPRDRSAGGSRVPKPILAVDVGATNLRCALVSATGAVLARESVPTPPGPDLASTLAAVVWRVRGEERVAYAVVGVPGRVDYSAGALAWGRGQSPEWRETFSEARLGSLLGCPVSLANDADLATVGEARFGAGAGHADVVYLTISSGVGSGAVIGGRLLRGWTKLCEVGLTLVGLPDGDDAEPAVLEDLASGRGLESAARRAGVDGSVADIVAAVRAGDDVAARLWRSSSAAVALAAVNLAHLLVPEVVVIGGGVSRAGELLLGPVRDRLARYGPRDLPTPIQVRQAALGDDAGLVGAAGWQDAVGPPRLAEALGPIDRATRR